MGGGYKGKAAKRGRWAMLKGQGRGISKDSKGCTGVDKCQLPTNDRLRGRKKGQIGLFRVTKGENVYQGTGRAKYPRVRCNTKAPETKKKGEKKAPGFPKVTYWSDVSKAFVHSIG